MFRPWMWSVLAGLTALHTAAAAWSLFEQPIFSESPLSPSERAQLDIQAGWARGQEQTLLVEVRNRLSFPVQCSGVEVEFLNGQRERKTLTPKLFVPAASSRNASVPGVPKGTMRAFALACNCFKKQGQGTCVHPSPP